MSGLHFQLAAFIRWGTSETEPELEINPHYESMPMGGLQTSPLVRQRIRPLLLRLDTHGGFHVWNAKDASITSLAAEGTFRSKISLPADDGARLIDYAAGDGRLYLLMTSQQEHTGEVRCIDSSGAVIWSQAHAVSGANTLALMGQRLFVSGKSQPTKVWELDIANGKTVREHQLQQGMIRPFASADAVLVSSTFFRQQRRRGVVIYHPADGKERSSIAAPELYGPLLSAFGTDRAQHIYLYGTAHKSTVPAIFQVDHSAKLVRTEPLQSVVLGPGQQILAVRLGEERFQVQVFAAGKSAPRGIDIERPAALQGKAVKQLQVVGTGENQLLLDVVRDTGSIDKRMSLDLTTFAVREVADTDDVRTVYGLQPVQTWQTGADGEIYIPVTSASGLAIVRTSLIGP